MTLLPLLAPELTLIAVACALFFLGTSNKVLSRRASAGVALAALLGVFVWQLSAFLSDSAAPAATDEWNTVRLGGFTTFVKMLVSGVGALLVLLAWPSDADGTGSPSMNFGAEAGEFFGLLLLSLSGVMVVAEANDLILLFLGIELASIPTYIMVSISRPLPVAQEAGVKYFFLGAMAAAVMLFGFSYLYGTTGTVKLDGIAAAVNNLRNPASGGWAAPAADPWLILGVVVVLAGFAFKIAAVPLHAYAGDVYQGAATPVTAMLGFIPKTSGFLAILKILSAVGGEHWAVPDTVVKVLWVVAAVTMTVGNVLGLIQLNVKRVFAYSSVAHSGYMLVGVTALVSAAQAVPAGGGAGAVAAQVHAGDVQAMAIRGVLFYLLSYGLMNTGAMAMLMLLPSRAHKAAGSDAAGPPLTTTAETYEDLAGQGRVHPWIGLGMAICCFSLTGIPLTVGFLGKYYLVQPAVQGGVPGLAVIMMVNAAIAAAYYLKVVATLFVRPAPAELEHHASTGVHPHLEVYGQPHPEHQHAEPLPARGRPLMAAVVLTIGGTLFMGTALPFVDAVSSRLTAAAATPWQAPASPVTTRPSTRPAAVAEVPLPVAVNSASR